MMNLNNMGYKQPSYLRQTWWVIKYAAQSWIKHRNAMNWAKDFHPAWLEIATKCKNKETRQYYKLKILNAYNEMNDMFEQYRHTN